MDVRGRDGAWERWAGVGTQRPLSAVFEEADLITGHHRVSSPVGIQAVAAGDTSPSGSRGGPHRVVRASIISRRIAPSALLCISAIRVIRLVFAIFTRIEACEPAQVGRVGSPLSTLILRPVETLFA